MSCKFRFYEWFQDDYSTVVTVRCIVCRYVTVLIYKFILDSRLITCVLACILSLSYCEFRRVLVIYLLLTEFEVRTVSYGPSFFPLVAQINGKKGGSVTYSTDRENEVSKIFIISLRLTVARARKLVKVKRKVQLPQRMPCQNPKN